MLKSELAPEKHPLHSIRRFVVGANRFPHREHGRAVAPSNGFSPPPRAAPGIGPRKIAFFSSGRSLGWTILGINAVPSLQCILSDGTVSPCSSTICCSSAEGVQIIPPLNTQW